MAKRTKHDKVIRTYDGIDREESTLGLLLLRIFIILVIILFVLGAAALFVYKLQRETNSAFQSTAPAVEENIYYQKYDTDVDEQLLEYCNNSVTLSEYNTVELVDWSNSVQVNALMKQSLDKMIEAAARDGITLDVVQGYVSYENCNTLNKSYKMELEQEGAAPAEAELQASAIFPSGSSNEFRTGMLIKLSDMESDDFALTDAYSWLYKNGVNFGFINRYTEEKFDVTGINEDLTVYRFVGTENAQKMRSFGMCLEEYYDYKSSR